MEPPVMIESNARIQILSDLEAVSNKAAEIFVNISGSCIRSRAKFSVALSGGATPIRLYNLLGSGPYHDQVPWQQVHFFWVDERCVPKEHETSNFRAVFGPLLSKIPVSEKNIHRIKAEGEPRAGADEYEMDLKKFFGLPGFPAFDLIILGMGADGHTASLFPGSKALEETARFAVPVYIEKPEWNRITLTLPVLNHAFQILFLVAGRSKADVLGEIFREGGNRRRFPAGLVRPIQGSTTWLVDREAAQRLKGNVWE